MKLYVYWVHFCIQMALFTYICSIFEKDLMGSAVVRGPWPGRIRGGYLNPLIPCLKRLNPKGRRIDVRSTAADPLKGLRIVSAFALVCSSSRWV